jgi:large subunit ribosomal protein L6e
MARSPRNVPLVPGVSTLSRSQAYKTKALFKRNKVAIPKKTVSTEEFKTVKVGGAKNGGTRKVSVVKAPRFYEADDIKKPKTTRKTIRPSTIRASITPGTVLVLLSGRFKGKVYY